MGDELALVGRSETHTTRLYRRWLASRELDELAETENASWVRYSDDERSLLVTVGSSSARLLRLDPETGETTTLARDLVRLPVHEDADGNLYYANRVDGWPDWSSVKRSVDGNVTPIDGGRFAIWVDAVGEDWTLFETFKGGAYELRLLWHEDGSQEVLSQSSGLARSSTRYQQKPFRRREARPRRPVGTSIDCHS